jgi:hypothetical protein
LVFVYFEILIIIPTALSKKIRDEPPALIKGNVIPVTGINPVDTAV